MSSFQGGQGHVKVADCEHREKGAARTVVPKHDAHILYLDYIEKEGIRTE